MQIVRHQEQHAELVGWAVSVMLLAAPGSESADRIANRIAGFGGQVDRADERYSAVSALIEDPAGYGLFVMECDGLGGIEGGHEVIRLLRAAGLRLPVILISRDCAAQVFPDDPLDAVQLRAPLSAVSLRVGFEHALRERMFWRAA